jgi:long-chain acyl-CoA synthetase
MAHIFSLIGCLFVPLLYRMTAVILPGFTPRNVFSAMRVHHVDYLTAVPELLGLMARVRPAGLRLPGLEAFVSGGSHLSAEADARIRQAFGVEILHGYGLTEFAPACGNVRGKTVPGSAGPECQNARVRIANPDTQGQGEILIRSDRMFRGYYRKPEETSRSWTGGWFRTGDLGRFAGGSLVFVRELKPTCKINGAMVDLAEVRRAIVSLPGIESADVDCREGQLVACVEGVHLDREGLLNLRRALGELVAWYKVPRRIHAPAGDSGR